MECAGITNERHHGSGLPVDVFSLVLAIANAAAPAPVNADNCVVRADRAFSELSTAAARMVTGDTVRQSGALRFPCRVVAAKQRMKGVLRCVHPQNFRPLYQQFKQHRLNPRQQVPLMALAYTHIGRVSGTNALDSMSSANPRRETTTRELYAGDRWHNKQEIRGADETAPGRTEDRTGESGGQRFDEELAVVLIGLKACIQVSIQRVRNSGRAPDPSLLNASTLADLAIAAIRQLRVDRITSNRVKTEKNSYPT